MTYRVELTRRAAADADASTEYIRQFAPEAARRWFAGLIQAVLSLAEMPRRCPVAPESEKLGIELRQLLYGRRAGVFRIVFRVYDDAVPGPVVRVVAIRHGARDRLQRTDFDEVV